MGSNAAEDASVRPSPPGADSDASPCVAATSSQRDEVQVRVAPDRRKHADRERLFRRIQGEFEEMPGLRLTLPQAARLFGVPELVCHRILSVLVDGGFLRVTVGGTWVRHDRCP
jgi:hypothetical protein